LTTFDFGNGPVPAHRHVNPNGTAGGWVADTTRVDPSVHVGMYARSYGKAVVEGGRIEDRASIGANAI